MPRDGRFMRSDADGVVERALDDARAYGNLESQLTFLEIVRSEISAAIVETRRMIEDGVKAEQLITPGELARGEGRA